VTRGRDPLTTLAATVVAVAVLALAACSDDDAGSPTTAPGTSGAAAATEATDGAGTTSPGTSAEPSGGTTAPGVSVLESTTSAVPIVTNDDAGETLPPPSTTAAPTFEERAAERRVRAGLEALPEGWEGTVADNIGGVPTTAETILYTNCLGDDGYDFANLDADSEAAWQLTAAAPAAADGTPGAEANLEARVFTRNSTADEVYETLVNTLTTDEGRACMQQAVPTALVGLTPEGTDITVTVEDSAVPGLENGAHVTVNMKTGTLDVTVQLELGVQQLADGTLLLSSFFSITDPVDAADAAAIIAAVAA
jgi:hypothetical protein